MSGNTKKLAVLRARTDSDLLILVQRELDRSLALLDLSDTRNSPFFIRAEKARQTAAALLLKISALSQNDRLSLEARMRELRARLDQVPGYANLRRYPASYAS